MTSPLGKVCIWKFVLKRQSKSVVSVWPFWHTPLASERETSMAVTVRVKDVLTCAMDSFKEWACGSVQGTVADGQFSVTVFETLVPGLNVTGMVVVVGAGAVAEPFSAMVWLKPVTLF